MQVLADFLASPWIALLVLAVLVAETALLLLYWRARRRGVPPAQVIAFLGSGACFAAALYLVLADASPLLVGLALTGALAFHLWDLFQRWR